MSGWNTITRANQKRRAVNRMRTHWTAIRGLYSCEDRNDHLGIAVGTTALSSTEVHKNYDKTP